MNLVNFKTAVLAGVVATAGAAANASPVSFTDIAAGTIVSSISSGGVDVGISGTGNGLSGNRAMVFDTADATGNDDDLQAPFYLDTGAGQQTSGVSISPGEALILSGDLDSSDPDDFRGGGFFEFTFSKAINLKSILLLDDIDATFTSDKSGNTSESVTSDNEFKIADFSSELGFTGITYLKVELSGSGAIDDITFDITPVPLPAGALLLISGLGGLAVMRRRSKS